MKNRILLAVIILMVVDLAYLTLATPSPATAARASNTEGALLAAPPDAPLAKKTKIPKRTKTPRPTPTRWRPPLPVMAGLGAGRRSASPSDFLTALPPGLLPTISQATVTPTEFLETDTAAATPTDAVLLSPTPTSSPTSTPLASLTSTPNNTPTLDVVLTPTPTATWTPIP